MCARLQLLRSQSAVLSARTKIWSHACACGWKKHLRCIPIWINSGHQGRINTHTPRPDIMCVSCNIYISLTSWVCEGCQGSRCVWKRSQSWLHTRFHGIYAHALFQVLQRHQYKCAKTNIHSKMEFVLIF